MRKNSSVVGLAIAVMLGAASARGAELQAVVTAWEMEPGSSAMTWDFDGLGYRYRTGGSGPFLAGVPVPHGAIVHAIALQACDFSDAGEVKVQLSRMNESDNSVIAEARTGVAETPGCTSVVETIDTPETINQTAFRYLVVAVQETTDGSTAIGAVRIEYSLQVSPAPPQATFNDVPTGDPGFQFIEALFASGITAGCGNGNYCPDAPLTRRQMAVFLSKALGLYWPAGFFN